MNNPILALFVIHGGSAMEVVATLDVSRYSDAAARKDVESILAENPDLTPNESLQLIIHADGTSDHFVSMVPSDAFACSSLSGYLEKLGKGMALEKGYTLGQPTDNPRLYDEIFPEDEGLEHVRELYETV